MQLFLIRVILVPATADFFRRPKVLQTGNDVIPLLSTGTKCSALLLPATTDIQILCTPVIIPVWIIRLAMWLKLCAISFDLTTDGRGTTLENSCNFS